MAAKKLDDQQIQHCIKVLDALAQSGQSVKAFAQTQGEPHGETKCSVARPIEIQPADGSSLFAEGAIPVILEL